MRHSEIDGIRGYASLVVLFYHMIFTPFGHMGLEQNSGFLLFNAIIAVQIFFILSGDALSAAFFASNNYKDIDKLLVKRYFRLTMPILLSSFVIFFLMSHGLDFHLEAARRINNQVLLHYLPQEPNFSEMLMYALAGVYFDYNFQTQASFYESLKTAYNPVFWTMAIEMIGSLLVFLFLYIYPRLTKPHVILLFLCAAFFILSRTFSLFFIGICLGYWRQMGWLDAWRTSPRWQIASAVIFTAYVLLSALFLDSKNRDISLISAVMLVFLFYTNNSFVAFFRTPFARWLGGISFPLYAIHFAVLISLTSWMILRAMEGDGLTSGAMAFISVISILLSILVACALRRIEIPYLRFLNLIAVYALGEDNEDSRVTQRGVSN